MGDSPRLCAVAVTDPDLVCAGTVAAEGDLVSIGRINSAGIEKVGEDERFRVGMRAGGQAPYRDISRRVDVDHPLADGRDGGG